ncbi:MAG: ABC transporter permease [Candidatus Schekmanbacteria bacterium]|nr:ABC transporter permease [Candidatus Schekmanbacteria bacterium]
MTDQEPTPAPRLAPAFRNVSRRARRVWQRNFDVFRATWLTSFIPPLLEPVFYVLAFGFGLGSLVRTVPYKGGTIDYLPFMAPGVIAVAAMFWSYFETTFGSFVRMYYQRTFDAIISTPLLVEDVIAGEWLWGATKSVIAGTIMLLMLSLFGLVAWPSGILVVPLVFACGCVFSALGLVATALVPKIDAFNLPMFVLIFPMFLFSGTFFPLDILPPWALAVAMTLPLTHVCSLIRGACLGVLPPFWLGSVGYLAVVTPVTVLLALRLMLRRLVK